MKQRKYFEMLAYVGKSTVPDKDYPYDAETLLSDMAYARIHGAACIHNVAKSYSYELGNREAIKLAQENPRLYGLALVPSIAHIETNNAAYYEDLLSSGIRGFAMLPNSPLSSSMEPGALEKIAQALITHRRPLIALGAVNEEQFSKCTDWRRRIRNFRSFCRVPAGVRHGCYGKCWKPMRTCILISPTSMQIIFWSTPKNILVLNVRFTAAYGPTNPWAA